MEEIAPQKSPTGSKAKLLGDIKQGSRFTILEDYNEMDTKEGVVNEGETSGGCRPGQSETPGALKSPSK